MVQDILKGIQAYFGAFQLIFKLKLWSYFIIPILISFITAIVIIVFSYVLSDNLGNYIADFWKWEFGKQTFEMVSTFLSGVLIIVIGLLMYKHIIMAFSAPFMSPVSEKIEEYLTGIKSQHIVNSFQQQLLRSIKLTVRNLIREILVTIPILLLSIIPVIGIFFTFLLFIVQAYYAGFGNMDYTLERYFSYKESVKFLNKNKGVAIGNGIVFILFLVIPVIGVILVLPLSVTAATKETVKRLNQN